MWMHSRTGAQAYNFHWVTFPKEQLYGTELNGKTTISKSSHKD